MRIGQHAVCPPDVIEQFLWLSLLQGRPRIGLMLDNLQHHFVDSLDDIRLTLAQCHLIGHLKNVPERFGAFPV